MRQQVPEGSRDRFNSEITELVERLQGHRVFNRMRGTWGLSLGSYLSRIAKGNPHDFKRILGERVKDFEIMGTLLTQLKRDGKTYAHQELLKALKKRGYVLSGEIVPAEETYPLTVVMAEPEKTLLMIRWLLEVRNEEYLHRFLLKIRPGTPLPQLPPRRKDDLVIDESGLVWKEEHDPVPLDAVPQSHWGLTCRLFHEFRYLRQILSNHHRTEGRRPWFFYGALMPCFLTAHWLECGSWLRERVGGMPLILAADQFRKENIPHSAWNGYTFPHGFSDEQIGKCSIRIDDEGLGFCQLVDEDQQDVLKRLARWDQSNIATWQLRFPNRAMPPQRFGVYPEGEYPACQRQYPLFVSKGVQAGIGVVAQVDSMIAGLWMYHEGASPNSFTLTLQDRRYTEDTSDPGEV